MFILPIGPTNRSEVNTLLQKSWGDLTMITQNHTHYLDQLPGFVYQKFDSIQGIVTYSIQNQYCEIVSLNSFDQNVGIGSHLLNKVIEVAQQKTCQKVWLITTNDNLNALKFYQKRGFDLVRLNHNAITRLRLQKRMIPLIGLNGIPIRHELVLEHRLDISHPYS